MLILGIFCLITNIMTKVRMYVLRSECGTITKFGQTENFQPRITGLISLQKQNFYAVYVSHYIDKKDALGIEKQINIKYKDDVIKGNEWLSTHPLEIINFIINIIGLKHKHELNFTVCNQYPMWFESSSKYKGASKERANGVRENNKGECFIRVMNNMQFIYLGFCNSGDAERTARSCTSLIQTTPIITELLHSKTYKDWRTEALQEFKHYLPTLNVPLKGVIYKSCRI